MIARRALRGAAVLVLEGLASALLALSGLCMDAAALATRAAWRFL